MATERYQQQTTIQPSGPVPDPGAAEQARGFQRIAATADYFGGQIAQEMQRDALIKAETDAPQIIQRDGNGALIAPSTFDPVGGGPIYRDRFRQAARSIYINNAVRDFSNKADAIQAAFPTNPTEVTNRLRLH